MKMMRVEWNKTTGVRAGPINPKSPDHICNPLWQGDSFEYRLLRDKYLNSAGNPVLVDHTKYEGITGITLYDTFEEAESAMTADGLPTTKTYYKNNNPALTQANMALLTEEQLNSLDTALSDQEELEALYGMGMSGISLVSIPRTPVQAVADALKSQETAMIG